MRTGRAVSDKEYDPTERRKNDCGGLEPVPNPHGMRRHMDRLRHRRGRSVTRCPSVVVVGAGIVGASLAYHLASAGSAVTIVERSYPASGVTGRSFAWINVVHGNTPEVARLRDPAIADYRRLERELNGALAVDWNGALSWSGNPADSEQLVAEHAAWGHDLRLVERDEIRRLEPHLVAPPPVAACTAYDGALDPVAATMTLVRAATEAGARIIRGVEVTALATTDRRVSGVVLPGGRVEADVVVIAAGADSTALCADVGIDLPVESSPATLTRFTGPRGLVGRVVSGPDLEIRQDTAGRLFVSDYYVEGEAPDSRAADTLALIRRRFRGADTVTSVDARVGWRPMPADGMPIVGFAQDAPGLYLAVMHAGVVMAPVVGRLATGEIVAENVAQLLVPCRASRFG